jgi:hypothetical protein
MSVEYFAAPDDEAAAAVLGPGPEGTFESLQYGNFDGITALAEWDSILTGRDLGDLSDAEVPRIVADDEGGTSIVAASSELQAALAAADRPALARAAARWVELQEEDAEEYDVELFSELLCELADLARAAGDGKTVYCWMG